jgi:hypothetical protein
MKIKVVVFWVVTSCCNVVEYQRFEGPYCVHLQGEQYLSSSSNTSAELSSRVEFVLWAERKVSCCETFINR